MAFQSNAIRRAAIGGAIFIAGVVFASGMHWTRSASAQALTPPRQSTAQPAAWTPVDFSAVAARVTPAVVSIRRGA